MGLIDRAARGLAVPNCTTLLFGSEMSQWSKAPVSIVNRSHPVYPWSRDIPGRSRHVAKVPRRDSCAAANGVRTDGTLLDLRGIRRQEIGDGLQVERIADLD